MPKTTVRDPPRANGWTLAHCPPSSDWVPGGNTGGIKALRKGTGHPTPKFRWLRTSVLSNRHSPTYGLYMGLTFTFYYFEILIFSTLWCISLPQIAGHAMFCLVFRYRVSSKVSRPLKISRFKSKPRYFSRCNKSKPTLKISLEAAPLHTVFNNIQICLRSNLALLNLTFAN